MAICNNKKCSLSECDQPETCTAYVPVITNADRIRSMSDEDLANWLALTQYANMMEAAEIFGAKLPFKEETLKDSEKECLEWLKQPPKGE